MLLVIYDNNCKICNKTLDKGKKVYTTCGHKFHDECISEDMEKNKTPCPTCKNNDYGILNRSHPFQFELKAYLKKSEALVTRLKSLGWDLKPFIINDIIEFFGKLFLQSEDQFFNLEKFFYKNLQF